jgi:hypothetical protein
MPSGSVRAQTDDKRLVSGRKGNGRNSSGTNSCEIESPRPQGTREPRFNISLERSEPWFSAEVETFLEVERRLM